MLFDPPLRHLSQTQTLSWLVVAGKLLAIGVVEVVENEDLGMLYYDLLMLLHYQQLQVSVKRWGPPLEKTQAQPF